MIKESDKYSKSEAQNRFESALRGSRNIGPQPMKSMTPKRKKSKQKPSKKATATASA